MRTLSLALLAGVIFLGAATADGCSVPVFRYALEQWPPEPYLVYVFHRGPLAADPAKIVEWLRKCSEDAEVRSNMEVWPVDLDGKPDAEALEVWKRQSGATLPWMVVRYPALYERAGDVWAGPLSASSARAVLDSPARREIARRILSGEAAVFLLLESGDPDGIGTDAAAEKTLKDEIARLPTTIELPEIQPEDVEAGAEPPKLAIALSCLRISRRDEAERVFLRMLLLSEPDLESSGKPIVFPVFGQGRLLCALVGPGITAENVRSIGEFVVGPCSCVVKDQNPGVDLLMSVNWSALPDGRWVKPQEMPALTGLEGFAGAEPDNAPPAARVTVERTSVVRVAPLGYALLAALLVLLAVIVVATVVIARRKSGPGGVR